MFATFPGWILGTGGIPLSGPRGAAPDLTMALAAAVVLVAIASWFAARYGWAPSRERHWATRGKTWRQTESLAARRASPARQTRFPLRSLPRSH